MNIREMAFKVEAVLRGWTKLSDGGVSLRFAVHPDDTGAIINAELGKRFQLVFVEIGDDEQPVFGGSPNSAGKADGPNVRNLEKHPHSTMQWKAVEGRPAPDTNPARALNRYAQRAGILCNDPRFQGFLLEKYGGEFELLNPVMRREWAAQKVRELCEVDSRAEILPNTPAANRFDILESAYLAECK
jgi:hypothetical protein